jgi:hypothetical protein
MILLRDVAASENSTMVAVTRTHAAMLATLFLFALFGAACTPTNPIAANEHFLLAYIAPSVANSGVGAQRVMIRQSSDGRSWTDVALPAGAEATGGGGNGVGIGADRPGLQRLLAVGKFTKETSLRYSALGAWEGTTTEDNYVPPTGANPANRNVQSAPSLAHQPGRNWIVAMNSCAGELRLLEFNPAAQPGARLTQITSTIAPNCAPESSRRPVIVTGRNKMLVANLVAPGGTTERLDLRSATPTANAAASFAPLAALPAPPAGQNLLDICLTQDNRGAFYLGMLTVQPGLIANTNQPHNPSVRLFRADESTLAFTSVGPAIENLGIGQARRLQCAAKPGGGEVLVLTVGEFEQTATLVNVTAGTLDRFPANAVRSIFTSGGAANLPFSLTLGGQPPS